MDKTILDVESFPILPDCLDPKIISIGVIETLLFIVAENSVAVDMTFTFSVDLKWIMLCLKKILNKDLIIGHRICYDFGVILKAYPSLIEDIEKAFSERRVFDTRIAESRIIGVKNPEYAGLCALHPDVRSSQWKHQFPNKTRELGLAQLSEKYNGPVLDKSDWCVRFSELEGKHIKDWPTEAILYCSGDLRATDHVSSDQIANHGVSIGYVPHEVFLMHQKQCLDVSQGIGFAIDPKYALKPYRKIDQ